MIIDLINIVFYLLCEGWYFTSMWKALACPLHIFTEVPVPRQECERLCICVLGVSILHLSTILPFKFGIVSIV